MQLSPINTHHWFCMCWHILLTLALRKQRQVDIYGSEGQVSHLYINVLLNIHITLTTKEFEHFSCILGCSCPSHLWSSASCCCSSFFFIYENSVLYLMHNNFVWVSSHSTFLSFMFLTHIHFQEYFNSII